MGILLASDGTRFPLPALPYYTKQYCRQHRIKFKTQVELAAQMIRDAPIPLDVGKVIVLADEYYEGGTVHQVCATKGYSYIMPTDSRRCLADKQGHRTAVTLHERGRHLSRRLFRKIVLVEGQEKTVSYRRLSEPGRKTKRVYRAHTEAQMVTGLDLVRITYSWKRKRRKGKYSGGDTYKVLVSNDMTLSVEQIIEYYELRWQIELFFRELKSAIGFNRFRGDSFTAYARFVSMVLLSFLFLEWTRFTDLKKTSSRKQSADLAKARTHGLVNRLQNDIETENVEYILDCFEQKQTRAECINIFRKLLRAA
jgi:SRSO17 transposase